MLRGDCACAVGSARPRPPEHLPARGRSARRRGLGVPGGRRLVGLGASRAVSPRSGAWSRGRRRPAGCDAGVEGSLPSGGAPRAPGRTGAVVPAGSWPSGGGGAGASGGLRGGGEERRRGGRAEGRTGGGEDRRRGGGAVARVSRPSRGPEASGRTGPGSPSISGAGRGWADVWMGMT